MSGLADAVVAGLMAQRDLMHALDERLRAISVRVASADDAVCVEVDGLGAMTGLWLAPNAYRHGAEALGQLVVDTARAAADEVQARQQGFLDEYDARAREVRSQTLSDWGGTPAEADGPAPTIN
jgi:DNA-binding protein YbaB